MISFFRFAVLFKAFVISFSNRYLGTEYLGTHGTQKMHIELHSTYTTLFHNFFHRFANK